MLEIAIRLIEALRLFLCKRNSELNFLVINALNLMSNLQI